MRVVLVVPPQLVEEEDERVEYLGLGYVAAMARRHGYSVDIIDCRYPPLDYEDAVQKIDALSPHVVGVTAPFALDLTSTVKLSQMLRNAKYEGLIVVGGHPATFTYHTLLSQFPTIDVVVRGEGEVTFLELLQRPNKGHNWRQVPGIAYREDGQVVATEPRPLIGDLDSLPFPARDNLTTAGAPASVAWFRSQGVVPGTMIASSRGCPFRCTFCSVQAFYRSSPGPRWRARSAMNVIDEMTDLVEKWGVRMFRFSDDNFLGSCQKGKMRARELATLLIERDLGVKFIIECRVTDVEYPLFSLLKRAGLTRVHLGIESGIPRMLENFSKHATPEQNKEAISMLKELGIEYHPNFILVDPETTLEELRQNLVFFRDTRMYQAPNAFHILYSNRLGLFAGTPLLERYQAAHRAKPWRFQRLTEEEDTITATIGAIMDYEMKDPQVMQFLKLHLRVISELTRRDKSLVRLQRQLHIDLAETSLPHSMPERQQGNGPGLFPRIERWRANAGTLALRLFEQTLTRAERGAIKDETVERHFQEFLSEIDRYDILHFEKTVDKLVQTANTVPAAC